MAPSMSRARAIYALFRNENTLRYGLTTRRRESACAIAFSPDVQPTTTNHDHQRSHNGPEFIDWRRSDGSRDGFGIGNRARFVWRLQRLSVQRACGAANVGGDRAARSGIL